jgi:hypothetical protein
MFRIRGDLRAMIIGAASPLAGRIAARRLRRLKIGWLETALTIPTFAYATCRRWSHWRSMIFRLGDLESSIESCTVPSQSRVCLTTKPARLRSFYSGEKSRSRTQEPDLLDSSRGLEHARIFLSPLAVLGVFGAGDD